MGIRDVARLYRGDKRLHVDMGKRRCIGPPRPRRAIGSSKDVQPAKARARKGRAPPPPPPPPPPPSRLWLFLSEREAFPKALGGGRHRFIGPNPVAIAAMGDKIESPKAQPNAKDLDGDTATLGVIEGTNGRREDCRRDRLSV